ncbi:MAG: cytochrome c5 family protein [Gammaproteobacteria bacterium]|jgi:cytochrome c5|nr:cytochrome c5 family protein [Gammaproteobacteria bacterium]
MRINLSSQGNEVIGDLRMQSRYGLVLWFGLVLFGCGGNTSPSAEQGSATSSANLGAEIYQNYCASCHNSGISGAPKLGDKQAWGPRIAKGRDLLLQATIVGVQPSMPPKGMCFRCSDDDLGAAVDYMMLSAAAER